jgi:drug/metabolite transporter (DMT)-like permease
LKGAAFGFAAVSIWASWSVVTRLAVTTSLDASDIAALRFGIAGLLLSPVLMQRGLAHDRLGWLGLGVLIAGFGAPYALVAATGLRFAPAYDGGALNPGCMPLFVSLISAIVMREKLSSSRILGLSLILAGAVIIVGWHAQGRGAAWGSSRTFGDGLFLIAAFLTACSTLVMRRARLDPLHAAALVATGSLVIYLPIYVALYGMRLARIPLADLAVQALFQGVVVTIVSLVLYGRAVAILGASGGSALGALVPALSALIAIPLLGEWPNKAGWVGILLISAGVYLASGGPLPSWQHRGSGTNPKACDHGPRSRHPGESRDPCQIGAGLRRCDNVLGAICQNCSAGARAGALPVSAG